MLFHFATVNGAVQTTASILGISVLVIGGVIFLWSQIKKGPQDVLRTYNADLNAANHELRAQKQADDATIKQQAEALGHARDLATQTPAVTELTKRTNSLMEIIYSQQKLNATQHTEVMGHLSKLTGEMSTLTGEMSKVVVQISKYTEGLNKKERRRG